MWVTSSGGKSSIGEKSPIGLFHAEGWSWNRTERVESFDIDMLPLVLGNVGIMGESSSVIEVLDDDRFKATEDWLIAEGPGLGGPSIPSLPVKSKTIFYD